MGRKKKEQPETPPETPVDGTPAAPTPEKPKKQKMKIPPPSPAPFMTANADASFGLLEKLNTDLRAMAKTIPRMEARYLCDGYYQLQHIRIASMHQLRAADKVGESAHLLRWLAGTINGLEKNVKESLNTFAKEYRVGNWLQSICGVGPVISAALIAYLDVPPPKTVGHWWRFCGLDPSVTWRSREESKTLLKEALPGITKYDNSHLQILAGALDEPFGRMISRMQNFYTGVDANRRQMDMTSPDEVSAFLARRPWSARLRTLCSYKIGESFVKVQNNPKDFYGKLWFERKTWEIEQNEMRRYAEQAAEKIRPGAKGAVGKGTAAYKFYKDGRLPPAHIHARARRWAVKLFLSHVHQVFWEDYYGTPVQVPFVFTKAEGDHRHFIAPPNWPVPPLVGGGNWPGKRLNEMVEGKQLPRLAATPDDEFSDGDDE